VVKKIFILNSVPVSAKIFGMILRDDNIQIFKKTKDHNIPYYLHTYYKKSICPNYLKKGKISNEEWKNVKICTILLKAYFSQNKESNELECLNYFKNKLGDNYSEINDFNNEIKKAKNFKIYAILHIIIF